MIRKILKYLKIVTNIHWSNWKRAFKKPLLTLKESIKNSFESPNFRCFNHYAPTQHKISLQKDLKNNLTPHSNSKTLETFNLILMLVIQATNLCLSTVLTKKLALQMINIQWKCQILRIWSCRSMRMTSLSQPVPILSPCGKKK